jgi:hypothetical protein
MDDAFSVHFAWFCCLWHCNWQFWKDSGGAALQHEPIGQNSDVKNASFGYYDGDPLTRILHKSRIYLSNIVFNVFVVCFPTLGRRGPRSVVVATQPFVAR